MTPIEPIINNMSGMASERYTVNVRLTEEEAAQLEALQAELAVERELEVSKSDVVRLAIKALLRERKGKGKKK